uniref:Claudin-4-like n=1 Tax=Denticeps clupeoides TaxID=299321 RepID=A0AAY4DDG2_9TELE
MVSAGLQIMGTALGLLGWIGAIVACALPMWKMTAFIGTNIVTAQITWEGIWMSCVVQSTGQMQCKVYDSMLALPQDLQAARALIVIAVVVGILGILLAVAGGKCTNCVEDERAKSKAQKRELGASLYIGWGAAALMIIGGGLLCCNCPEKEDGSYTAKYKAARSQASAPTNKDYV